MIKPEQTEIDNSVNYSNYCRSNLTQKTLVFNTFYKKNT